MAGEKNAIEGINELNLTQIVGHVLKSNYENLISEYERTDKKFTEFYGFHELKHFQETI